jgi:hypothetical protein
MSFVRRQTENLRRLVEAGRLAARVPEAARTRGQRQGIALEGGTRCPRWGTLVYPLFPVPVLCEECQSELLARDQAEQPGCSWWGDLLARVSRRSRRPRPE